MGGEDPLKTEKIWHNMSRGNIHGELRGLGLHAMSGIDMALWDIKGKTPQDRATDIAWKAKTNRALFLDLMDCGLPIANHGFTTYINVTAALHWLNSIPNTLICEFVAEDDTNLHESITRQKLRAVTVPQDPGPGIDLHKKAVAKYHVG